MQAPFGFEEGKQAVDEAQGASSIRSSFVPHSRSKSLPLSKSLPAMLRAAMQAGPSLMVSWSHSLIVSKSQSLAAQPLSDASSTCCRSSELPGCFETVNMTEG